jgi:uncharacterized protein (UPF0335 family)
MGFKMIQVRKMSQTLMNMYNSMLRTLIDRRAELVKEIEEINHQIIELKNEAKENGVTIVS